MLNRKFFAFVLSCLLTIGAYAQSSTANAPSAKTGMAALSGVLLGLNVGAAITASAGDSATLPPRDAYRTLWIVRNTDQIKIAASLAEIVVPHGSGFWQIGTASVCEFDGTSNGNRAAIWASPLGKPATLYQGKPCVRSESVQTCGDVSATILFVSPSLISEEYTQKQAEECDPRGGRWTTVDIVRKFAQADALDISEFLGPAAETTYWQALQDGLAGLKQNGMNCPPPEKEQTNLANWSVTREAGGWHPVANGNIGLGECEIAHSINVVLPHSVTADTSSEQLFQSAKQNRPGLRDLIASPNGDWAVVVIENNGIQAFDLYEINGGQLGRKLLALDVNLNSSGGANHVISAQWAVGSHVADWTAALGSAAKRVDTKPRVLIDPSRARDVFSQQQE